MKIFLKFRKNNAFSNDHTINVVTKPILIKQFYFDLSL